MDIQPLIETFWAAIKERIAIPQKNDKWHSEALAFFRKELEPYVFQYMESHFGAMLTEHWKTHQFPVKSKYAWAITERRIHPNWWFVLRNLAWAAPDMALYIFCSETNKPYLESLLGDKAKNVHLIPWFKGNPTPEQQYKEFNDAWKTSLLWKHIDAEYILRIELDCLVLRKIPKEIFRDDFWGSPWSWQPERCGGGGLSVRNVAKCLMACEWDTNKEDILPEDCWLENRLTRIGFTYPPLEYRKNIFMENKFYETEYGPYTRPVGLHQFWTFVLNFNHHPPVLAKTLKSLLIISEN